MLPLYLTDTLCHTFRTLLPICMVVRYSPKWIWFELTTRFLWHQRIFLNSYHYAIWFVRVYSHALRPQECRTDFPAFHGFCSPWSSLLLGLLGRPSHRQSLT